MSTDGRYMYHHQPGIGASYDYAPYPPPPPPSSYDNSQISQPPPRQMRPVSTSSQSPTQPYNPPPPPTTSAAYPPPPSYAPNPYMTPTHPTQQQQHPPPPPTQWTSESWAHYNQGYAHQPPSHPPPAHPPPSSTTEPPQYSSAHSHHAHTHPHSHPHSHSHPPPPPHPMHQAPPPPHPSSSLRSTNVSGGSSVAEPQRGYSSGGSSNASTAAPGSGHAPGSSYLEPRRLDERQHPPPLLTQSSSSSAQHHHQHHQQHPHQQHQPPHHPTQAQHHHQAQPPPPSHSMSSAQYSPSIPPPPAPRRREDESPSTASPGTPTGLDFMKLLEAYRAIIDGSHAVSTTPGQTISADALEHMIQSAAFGAQMLESATMHEKPLSAPVGVTTTSSSEVAATSPEEKEREDVNANVKSSPNGSAPPSKRQKTDENSGSTEGQTCLGCNATSTPEWRRGPMGPRTLCNACGLVYAKLIKKRVRDRVSGKPKSAHLGNQRTAVADDSGDGESDDEEYGSPGRRSDGGDGNSG